MASLVPKYPNLKVRLIGGEPSVATRTLVCELGIENHVEFCAYVPNDQILHALAALDVFVAASFQEGLSISALEAMSVGLPVISTRCGGPESYIDDGINGRLTSFDAGGMVAAIG